MDKAPDGVTPVPETVEVKRPSGTAWYVVHTYSGYENKVRDNLLKRIKSMQQTEQIFDVLVPTETEVEVDKRNRKKMVTKRVYPGYVMVEMLMTDSSWYVVRNTPGVMGFVSPTVGNAGRPVPLLPEEVSKIKQLMGLEATPKVSIKVEVGQMVQIVDGPFHDKKGIVQEVDPNRAKVTVLLDMFGHETPSEVDFSSIIALD